MTDNKPLENQENLGAYSQEQIVHISKSTKSDTVFYFSVLKDRLKDLKIANLLVIAFLVGSLGVGVMAVQQSQDIREEASGYSASLELPSRAKIKSGDEVNIPVMLLSDNTPAKSISASIKFDPKYLELMDIKTFPDPSNLDRYQPMVGGQFDTSGVIVTANNSGVVRFKVDSTHDTSFKGVRGIDDPLVLLKFKARAKTKDPTIIKYITQSGSSMVISPVTGENILKNTGEMHLDIE